MRALQLGSLEWLAKRSLFPAHKEMKMSGETDKWKEVRSENADWQEVCCSRCTRHPLEPTRKAVLVCCAPRWRASSTHSRFRLNR